MTESQKTEIKVHLNNELALISGSTEDSGIEVEYTADDIDYASQITQHNLNLVLAERASTKAAQIKKALERMNSIDYGICEECDEAIGIARLKANPAAQLCVKCQEAADNGFGACA